MENENASTGWVYFSLFEQIFKKTNEKANNWKAKSYNTASCTSDLKQRLNPAAYFYSCTGGVGEGV